MATKYEDKNGRNPTARDQQSQGRKFRRQSGGGQTADWETCDGELLKKAIASIARDGGALRLGYTRDGGAYAIGIYGDGTPYTEYVPPSDDINEFLREVVRNYERV